MIVQVALIRTNGRYAIIKRKFTNRLGQKLARIHYVKGFPATVPAEDVVAVWAVQA
jgi:hypothetical protein